MITKNVKDFRPLLRDDSPGIIGLPETWALNQADSKLTALLMKYGPTYFRGHYRSLAAEDQSVSAA